MPAQSPECSATGDPVVKGAAVGARELLHADAGGARWLACEVSREYVGGRGYALVTSSVETDALGLPLLAVEEGEFARRVEAGTARPAGARVAIARVRPDMRKPRRVRPAENTWEALRRLLNARARLWQRCTGELAKAARHAAAHYASEERTRSSMLLTTGEMGEAVDWLTAALDLSGFAAAVDEQDRAYAERQALRAALYARPALGPDSGPQLREAA